MRRRAPGAEPRAPRGVQGGATPPLRVFYDGGCELCRSTREWARERDISGRLQFVNFRDASVGALPVPRAQLEREMWVRRSDGSLVAGAAAVAEVFACLPRWRWLAWVMSVPGLHAVAAVVYRLVARHRA